MARITFVLTAILLLLGGCWRRSGPTPAVPTPAPTVAPSPGLLGDPDGLRPLPDTPFGVQVPDNLGEDALARLTSLGARWARVNLFWRQVEPERTDPPTYRWEATDRRLRRLAEGGLRLIVTVRDNPSWAADTLCGPLRATGLAGFAQFMQAAVQRYSASPYGIRHWELYNEPDNGDAKRLAQLGGCWGPHGRQYADMLRAVYPAIKEADPQAQVLLGGIAYEDYDGSPFVPDFLDDVLDAGGGAYFDFLGFHYYPAFADVWNRYGNDLGGKAAYLRSELERFGLRKPLVVTEVGQPTAGPQGDEQPYSDERTSRYVVQAMARGLVADLSIVIWFTLVDHPADPRQYGLLRSDGTPKPVYHAFRILIRELDKARLGKALGEREVGTGKVEGYLFVLADGSQKAVLWSLNDQEEEVRCRGSALRIVGLYGDERKVQDGGAEDADGQQDGLVTVRVGPAPIYVQAWPEAR